MKSIYRGIPLAIALAASIAGASFAEAAAGRAERKTTPLTHAELYQLYGQKSWIWKEGAGYFSVQARRFIAWSKENGKPSYGVGRWFITGPGKLCFRAEWHARDGSSPATTCFSHAKRGGVIYQRREPDGAWYVFKNARARPDDEFAKLRRGNYVGASLNRIEARLGRVE
ncbi:DUF995 domain-containing protein [Sinorhizobium meliloti]|uniref:DUF995 domain-containing protein n=1 Tax=Rhizobium meliloti TaxID=382 RepID=UPI000FDCC2BB|nr:DUF995 domain-containing protein [Sinorhizobium meliloti]MDW9591859.1 DUF995 domain-containing protein [Sinorhizobium meliloti]MDX0185792.1 DUF995 domain-containing protein [Sinorhizobium meliloti]MDX0192264.1 DUF995 domain-containing protein [Sinorhizobium meliloti]MDX0316461.1 DUF995 domain-containing protein [Sinorhizobium meliloti]MDX0322703.1 DUF995 domain-containing protein [Sinorhizobium meliloti]